MVITSFTAQTKKLTIISGSQKAMQSYTYIFIIFRDVKEFDAVTPKIVNKIRKMKKVD